MICSNWKLKKKFRKRVTTSKESVRPPAKGIHGTVNTRIYKPLFNEIDPLCIDCTLTLLLQKIEILPCPSFFRNKEKDIHPRRHEEFDFTGGNDGSRLVYIFVVVKQQKG